MKIELSTLRKFSVSNREISKPEEGYQKLKVEYCAICKTDAKMWDQGHRDLVLPRVLGHELCAKDEHSGKRYAIWPGKKCGKCVFCRSGNEHLCEDMKIMGFHTDGGFSEYVCAPEECLVEIRGNIPPHLVCFTEPVGCSIHAIQKLGITSHEKVIIYGGGTLGLIIAFICKNMGAHPYVIEKNEEKIEKAAVFRNVTGIAVLKDTTESEFDAAISACPDISAFNLGIAKLRKGGRFCFFSGLPKNKKIHTNSANLIHYKELKVSGAYGLTIKNMREAIEVLQSNHFVFQHLVEDILPPGNMPTCMEHVLSGQPYKYIIDFTGSAKAAIGTENEEPLSENRHGELISSAASLTDNSFFQNIIKSVKPINQTLRASAQRKIDHKTKPLGALGGLEELAVQMCLIQQDLNPQINRKELFVFAGDHGVAEEGVSAFPSEVTEQMVRNFLNGGAAINVLCSHHEIGLHIVDMGVNCDFPNTPGLINKKIRKGTSNFALKDAMTKKEAYSAIEGGMAAFLDTSSTEKIDIVGLGEMGIANTASATAIISVITSIPVKDAVGRGTGVDDHGLLHKMKVIQKALDFHQPDPADGIDILTKIGGFEIAAIAGAALAAASKGTAVILDGLISTAGALIACLLNPDISGYLISGHKSVEPAHLTSLRHLNLKPVHDLEMRLGEGTGAALTIDIVDAACKIMRKMASFEEAGVAGKKHHYENP